MWAHWNGDMLGLDMVCVVGRSGELDNIEDRDSLVPQSITSSSAAAVAIDKGSSSSSSSSGAEGKAADAAAAAAGGDCTGSTVQRRDWHEHLYQGGYWQDLHRLLQVSFGDKILYVGDHMYADILRYAHIRDSRVELIAVRHASQSRVGQVVYYL